MFSEPAFVWPEVFTTGETDYDALAKTALTYSPKALAVADALHGWALCHVTPAPKNFGLGILHISRLLEIRVALTLERADALFDIWQRDPHAFESLDLQAELDRVDAGG